MNEEVLIILGIAIFLGFFVQTLVGFAGSLVSLPILLIGLNLPDAIAYISIFYFFSSVFLVSKEWKNIDKNVIWRLTWASIIGVVLGVLVLTYSRPVVLQNGLGVFILLYVAYVVFGKADLKMGKKGNFLFGAMGGFFSGVFSTGGPLYVISVKNTVQEVKVFRATMIGVLALVTVVRVPTLIIGGVLNTSHLRASLLIFPVFLLAQFLGRRLFPIINERIFKKVVLVLLCFSGLALLL